MGVAVNDCHTKVGIILVLNIHGLWYVSSGEQSKTTHGIRVLAELRRPRRKDVRRVELGMQRRRLTCVRHKEDFVVPLLLPHLLESVRDIERADLFAVLELEELVPAVSGHVDEDI